MDNRKRVELNQTIDLIVNYRSRTLAKVVDQLRIPEAYTPNGEVLRRAYAAERAIEALTGDLAWALDLFTRALLDRLNIYQVNRPEAVEIAKLFAKYFNWKQGAEGTFGETWLWLSKAVKDAPREPFTDMRFRHRYLINHADDPDAPEVLLEAGFLARTLDLFEEGLDGDAAAHLRTAWKEGVHTAVLALPKISIRVEVIQEMEHLAR